ncbi:magnesium transporter [Hyphobacterium sp. SN044]|uniref:magnesium transporter n=1 Tax=Hyphobacterium sp. SN044 TaxID=2912575 RepID=UPI001F030193|nr:magnesium transporter [Hyphobacterium sp. SN044]MCF8878767.1 magnesium transporter [Hyphobacterium sp. SN044]
MSETAEIPTEDSPQGEVDVSKAVALAVLIEEGDGEGIGRLLEGLHPADIADLIEQLNSEQQEELARIAPDILTGEVLANLQWDTRELVAAELDPAHLAAAIQELDSDDATLLVEELDDALREQVLAEVPEENRAALESSLSFNEETAGRLMQREFVAAPDFWTVGHTIDHMRAAGDELPELFFDVYVVNTGFEPVGAVPVSRLMRSKRDVKLADIMEEVRIRIEPDTDQEDVAYYFEKYHLISAPVVDASGRLSGMLTVDDMVEVIQEENKEDMLALAGVNEAGLTDTVLESVKSRAPWLLVNLGTAILASGVIAFFDTAISQLVALAVLMPIVASMGGNAGTQSLAVAVRAIASRDLTSANARRVIIREMLTGTFNGIIFAVVMGVVAGLWFQNWALAAVIAIAMVINLACAGLAGILVPMGLKRFGADPAVSSSVFVTTVTDVVGFFAFLGLAAMVLL